MFETYQFAGVYIAIQAVLTLYAQGKNAFQSKVKYFPPCFPVLSLQSIFNQDNIKLGMIYSY